MTRENQSFSFKSAMHKAVSKKAAGIFQRAIALHRQGELDAARPLYEKVLNLHPNLADATHLLGVLYGAQGQSRKARELISTAISANPDVPAYFYNLAVVLEELSENGGASENYSKAIALDPNYADAWSKLADLQRRAGNLTGASESYQRVLAIDPRDLVAWSNMAGVFVSMGEVEDALFCYRTAVQLAPSSPILFSNLLFALNYDQTTSLADHVEQHRKFGEMLKQLHADLTPPRPRLRGSDEPLRLGLVSGDFRNHPVGYFLENVLRHLDKKKFAIFLYPTINQTDAASDRFRSMVGRWTPIQGLDDEAAAEIVRGDGVDILIDLAGHTGNNRLGVFARRPSPLQVSWLGYFATTGLTEVDYILVDSHLCEPADQRFFSEKLWFLPDTRLCFTPPADDLEVGSLPALANGFITFGSFNNLAKINAVVLRLWSRVLAAVPGARLLMKAEGLSDAAVRQRLLEAFSAHGVSAERLSFEGWSGRKDYLAAYQRVDLALDPFPFTGGTTSFEALWMGVPFVTLRGDCMVSRQGVSILANLDMADWIAADEDDYLACAVRHSAAPGRLAQVRQGLRQRMLASPLCDASAFAANLGGALTSMWADHAALAVTAD